MPFFGPGIAPLTSSRFRSASTSNTVSPSWVTRLPPMRPAILMPFMTRDGVADRVRELHLHDRARAGLDHGDRSDSPCLRVEHLGHSQLAPENPLSHQTNASTVATWE